MKLLVCGGYGFIGSTFIKNHLNNFSNDEIINIDNLTIGSNKSNLSEINKSLMDLSGIGQNLDVTKEDIKNLASNLTSDVVGYPKTRNPG